MKNFWNSARDSSFFWSSLSSSRVNTNSLSISKMVSIASRDCYDLNLSKRETRICLWFLASTIYFKIWINFWEIEYSVSDWNFCIIFGANKTLVFSSNMSSKHKRPKYLKLGSYCSMNSEVSFLRAYWYISTSSWVLKSL